MTTLSSNGIVIANTDDTGKLVLLRNTNNKIIQLIELLNKNPRLLQRITKDNLSINLDSSQYNSQLRGIAPGYVEQHSGSIYVRDRVPLFFMVIIIAFESVNFSNHALDDVLRNPHRYKNANDYAKAAEITEFNTYKEIFNDIALLYNEGILSVPWYIPFTTDKNSILGFLIRGLSKILPAQLMIRYFCPMDLDDWLYETDRKPWYFFGKTHADIYRGYWHGPYPEMEPITPLNRSQEKDTVITPLSEPLMSKPLGFFLSSENKTFNNIENKDTHKKPEGPARPS